MAEKVINVFVAGEKEVGKTSLIKAFIDGKAVLKEPTLEGRFVTKVIKVRQEQITIRIYDTRYVNGSLYIPDAVDYVISCYAIDDKKSFKKVKGYFNYFTNAGFTDFKRYIVGLKVDKTREIDPIDGMKLAESCDAKYFEASPAHFVGIREIFESIRDENISSSSSSSCVIA